jgi:hypothetical protein
LKNPAAESLPKLAVTKFELNKFYTLLYWI